MTIVNFFLHLFKRNTAKVEVEDLDGEKHLGVVIKDRVKEIQNPGLDLKEEIHRSIFGFLSMVLKMCKCDLMQVFFLYKCVGRCSGLIVSALDSGLSGPGLSPGWGHCVVFLGKTLYSHSASLHPGV